MTRLRIKRGENLDRRGGGSISRVAPPYPFCSHQMSNGVRIQIAINFVFGILEYLQFDLLSSAFC